MSEIIDSYSESNFTGYYTNSTIYYVGQSFTGNGSILQSAKFYLAKTGTPTGSAYAKIYSHKGTYGSSSEPDALLATSDVLDVSTIGTEPSLFELEFTGDNRISLVDGTHYVAVFDFPATALDTAIGVGADDTSPTHSGNAGYEFVGGYNTVSTIDLCFYIYGVPVTPIVGNKYAIPPFKNAMV